MRIILFILSFICIEVSAQYHPLDYNVDFLQNINVEGSLAQGTLEPLAPMDFRGETFYIPNLSGTGNILKWNSGWVTVGLADGGDISGLSQYDVLFGAADGSIDQDAGNFSYYPTGSLSLNGTPSDAVGVIASDGTSTGQFLSDVLNITTGTSQVELAPNFISLINGGAGVDIQRLSGGGGYNIYLPNSNGISGQALKLNGSLQLEWFTPGTGTVTSIATTSPVLGGPITSTGTISLAGLSGLGTAGQMVRTNSSATAWEYFTPSFITDLSTFTTDDLAQGATNLYSQWITSGSDIHFDAGFVGIGGAPSYLFDVNISSKSFLRIDPTGDIFSIGDVGGLTNGNYFEVNNLNNYFNFNDGAANRLQIDMNAGGIISLYNGAMPGDDYFLVGDGTFADFVSPSSAKTSLAIASTDLSDFDEAAQDATSTLFVADNGDIDYTYNDAIPDIAAQIKSGVIVNADINASAAIDATKINTGVVDNTEFNYLNGVTSAVQTQLDNKGFTIVVTGTQNTINDATPYYSGAVQNNSSATADVNRIYIPVNCTLIAAYGFIVNGGTLSTTENGTFYARKNNTTDITISSTVTTNATSNTFSGTGLSGSFSAGDYFEGKWLTPTYATNPTNCRWTVVYYFRPN